MTTEARALLVLWLFIGALIALFYLLPSEFVMTADGEVTMGTTEPDTVEVACYTFRVNGKLAYECTDLGALLPGGRE